MDTPVWIPMGLGVIASLAMMVLALGFIKTLVILGVVVAVAIVFIAVGLLWGCIELERM